MEDVKEEIRDNVEFRGGDKLGVWDEPDVGAE